ncbi:MAG: 2,3-bisphosphoglycerate-independent phosphoglycerate mutase [Christensenellaceae bacterium]|nr:2,3-bisphosphoglycerate-independent phosphoglycerate mutase [Christensenellaceae bacterium]
MDKKLTALLILDGFGIRGKTEDNAIYKAGTPNIDALMAKYPHTQINASGLYVGLPDGQMGNSEVGHLNIGAGRVVYQELTRITKAIEDGDFFENPEFIRAVDTAKANGKSLHLMGLLSDGGVHSHITHLAALIKLARDRGLENIFVHCFMDGRDVPPNSGKAYVEQLEGIIKELGAGKVASVMGRFYAMDRDNRWERVERAYRALVYGEGKLASCAAAAVQESYDNEVYDEFIEPIVIDDGGMSRVKKGDSIIFFNFRPDRAREITRVFTQPGFDAFAREDIDPTYVCMTQYDKSFENVTIAFKPQTLENTLGEYIASVGKTQLRIAETEKYAHVTFFFNGGVEAPNANEDRALIPSPKVATYDLKPEMSAYEVAEEAVNRINSGKYDLMILNFANPDMVGHTGVMDAAVAAIKAVDECVGKVVDAILANGGQCIITADHGNSEQMFDETTGGPMTAHTTNPVPFVLVSEEYKNAELKEGKALCDIAPTLLTMMGIEKPAEMTGESIIK